MVKNVGQKAVLLEKIANLGGKEKEWRREEGGRTTTLRARIAKLEANSMRERDCSRKLRQSSLSL